MKGDEGGKIHVALIPDGNRRFAKDNDKPTVWGHARGVERMHDFIDWVIGCDEIDEFTAYALSEENLSRPEDELGALWDVYRHELSMLKTDPRIVDNRIKVRVVGDMSSWRKDVEQAADELMSATSGFSNRTFNILMVYSAEKEVESAAANGSVMDNLWVSRQVDLVIRTGGEKRLSGFLPIQTSYAEIYFSDQMFPDFCKKDFEDAMAWFSRRSRRFGR